MLSDDEIFATIRKGIAAIMPEYPLDTIGINFGPRNARKKDIFITFTLSGKLITWKEYDSYDEFDVKMQLIEENLYAGCICHYSDIIRTCKQVRQIAGYETVLKNKIADLEARCLAAEEHIAELKEENEHLRCAPGGPGYLEHEAHFEEIQKK